MKKRDSIITIFILTTVILLVIVFACLFVFYKIKPGLQKLQITQEEIKKQNNITEGTEFNTYRNEEFGFEFNFPKDWKIRENAFGSAVSKFNLVIEPTNIKYLPHPIRINILPNDWIEKVTKDMIESDRLSVDGVSGVKYKELDMGLTQIEYIFPLGDNKIVIGGKEQYEATLNEVLSTFKFLK